MPLYRDQLCEGACERLGSPCNYPILYVQVAERFKAVPTDMNGNLIVDGREVPWTYKTLGFENEEDKEAATTALIEHLLERDSELDPDLAKMQARAWLKELPCFLECEVINGKPADEEE